MKKFIFGLLALVIIGSAVFYACKKEDVKSNDIAANGLTKATDGPIYIPTNLEEYCYECNSCSGTGGNCLPEVVVRPKSVGIDKVHGVFAELIDAENKPDANEIKREIVAENVDIFLLFISEEWINRIRDNTGFVSVINHNEYNKYILSFRFINEGGSNTYFAIGNEMLIFDALYQSVVLEEDDE
jgi:hypothetical protein